MDVVEFVNAALDTVRTSVDITLDGLDADHLNRRPGDESNPVGWLIWHMARMQDRGIAAVAGNEQVWIADRWHERYGMSADPDNTGMGHDGTQVSAFSAPDAATLIEHYDAVLGRTREYLESITAADLERVVEKPAPAATVGQRLVAVVNGNMQHVGQAGYVRGLLEGRRWHPR